MRRKLIIVLIIALIFRLALAFSVWHPDVNNHIDWGIRFWEYGPERFYEADVWSYSWPNQPPGTIYIFAGIRKLFEVIFSFFWFLNLKISLFPSKFIFFLEDNLYPALLKLPAIFSDLGIAYLIYRLFERVKRDKVGFFGAILFLVNPVIWYNSAIWGQTDAVINFFWLLSVFFLLEKKLLKAVFSYFLSVYVKIPFLTFLPIFVIIVYKQKYKLPDILESFLIPLAFIGLVTLPFSQGEPFSWLINLYQNKVLTQQLQLISANAFNIWAGLTGIQEKSHALLLGPFSYQTWGILLFVISYIPPLYLIWKKQNFITLFWVLSIVTFSMFMLLTNMHERYLYHFFLVFTIVVSQYKKLLPIYTVLSGINLVNLYNFWWVPRINLLVDALSARDGLLPRVLGFVSFAIFISFYRHFLRFTKLLRIR